MRPTASPEAPPAVVMDADPVLDALVGFGGQMVIPVRGSSMHPTLVDGDRVIVGPFLGLPREGQIALGRQGVHLVVHRLVDVEMAGGRRRYVLQGDARQAPDRGLLREDLLGRVVAVERNGRRIEVDDSPEVLRAEMRRVRLRRRAPRLLRGAAILVMTALCAMGGTSASQEGTYAPSPDYRFGPGDVVSLRIWNGERLHELQLTVQSDGEAFLPLTGIGAMSVGGRTVIEVKDDLKQRLGAIYNQTYIELLLLKFAAHRVHLMGEVRTTARLDSGPGEWALRGPTTLVNFLSNHGGPTADADLMHIYLIRPTGERREVNLFRAVFHGTPEDNPEVTSGDLVYVPSMAMGNRKIFVLGEVRTPGVLNLLEHMNLVEAVTRAGGFTQKGYMKGVVVLNRGPEGETKMRIANFKRMHKKGDLSANIPLGPGDIVFVPRRKIATLQEVFSIINPALGIIESIYIIDHLSDTN
ncbi:MAG: SLBB domain-containing protein [Acidobacteriota bacterium]